MQKSETKHIHMLLALNASNVLEAFKNLEKGIYPYDNTQQPNKVLERTETKESIQSDKNLQKAIAISTPFMLRESSKKNTEKTYQISEVELSEITTDPCSHLDTAVFGSTSKNGSTSKSVVSLTEMQTDEN